MFTVDLGKIIDEFKLEVLCEGRPDYRDIKVTTSDINRPGLQLAGFFQYFGVERIQIIGKVEMTYLRNLSQEARYGSLNTLFQYDVPCVVIARGMDEFPEMIEIACKNKLPLLRTSEETSAFASNLIYFLNIELAPRETKHGVFVELYGEGVLILGESGVGKSETALELIKRGHRLVADDVVEIRRISNYTLVGSAPDIIRHFIEIRGIGILDVKNLYGVGSVRMNQNIDMVMNLELWNPEKQYDRLGLNDEHTEILGISVPSLTVPVRPGRNLAIILEAAARNNREKRLGYNAAEVLNQRVKNRIKKNTTNDME